MSNVIFEDYSVKVKDAMKDKVIAFLYEIGGELVAQTQRNSRRKTSQTAGSYEYKVDEGKQAVHIGSNYQNALWEEFGTGEHALNGDGRKGWWVYVTGASSSASSSNGKTYSSPAQAKRAVAILRSEGLDAHMTKGKTANRPLFKAYSSSKSSIISRARSIFGGLD